MKSIVLGFVLVLTCYLESAYAGDACTLTPCKLDEKTIRFYVLGDWGGQSPAPHTTVAQLVCANLTEDMGKDKRPQFIVSTGDQFYEWGVKNAEDPRFKTTFEDVYNYGKDKDVPWYMTQGNHDWYGNGTAQVGYSQISKRWVQPALAYSASYDAHPNGPSVDLISIDTIVLCGNTFKETDDDADWIEELGIRGEKTKGYHGPASEVDADSMWLYIESELAKSKADYLFVFGHYPMFSSDSNKVSHCLVPRLHDLMDKYNATAYLTGHSHTQQHLKSVGKNGQTMHHVLSGGGHLINAKFKEVFKNKNDFPWQVTNEFFFPMQEKNVSKIQTNMGGLVYAELNQQTAKFEYYKCDGAFQYSFETPPRKFV